MRDRTVVFAMALGVLGLLYVLFGPKTRSDPATETVFPLSTESRPDGLLALWRWLGEQHVPEASLRYRYDRLAGLLTKPTGNLLIMTLPQQVPARKAELAQLEEWVEAGNTLLILAAVDDEPLWSLAGDPLSEQKLKELTGLEFQTHGLGRVGGMFAANVNQLQADSLEITPRGEHPLLAGVRHVTAISFLKHPSKAPGGLTEVMPLELADQVDSQGTVLWLLRRGAGQIILSSVASPFSNRAVALGDNARLLANIIEWGRTEGGTVVFDDSHQGAAAYYDAGAFFADHRLYYTLLWILALWFAFVLGALPLRARQRQESPLDEGLYIEGSAGYFAAVVPPGEAAQRLIERFLEELRGQERVGIALWERFDAHPRVSGTQRRALHDFYEKACSGRRVDLARLQNLLAQLRGILE